MLFTLLYVSCLLSESGLTALSSNFSSFGLFFAFFFLSSVVNALEYIFSTLTKFFENELDKMEIVYVPSATNFITTIWKSEKEASRIVEKLMEAGIIVRHLKSFGWPNYIRISVGKENENLRLISTLKTIL